MGAINGIYLIYNFLLRFFYPVEVKQLRSRNFANLWYSKYLRQLLHAEQDYFVVPLGFPPNRFRHFLDRACEKSLEEWKNFPGIENKSTADTQGQVEKLKTKYGEKNALGEKHGDSIEGFCAQIAKFFLISIKSKRELIMNGNGCFPFNIPRTRNSNESRLIDVEQKDGRWTSWATPFRAMKGHFTRRNISKHGKQIDP